MPLRLQGKLGGHTLKEAVFSPAPLLLRNPWEWEEGPTGH